MDVEGEIRAIQAENLALQTLLSSLLSSMAKNGDKGVVEAAFNMADTLLEAASFAPEGRGPHAMAALKILEQLRAIAK